MIKKVGVVGVSIGCVAIAAISGLVIKQQRDLNALHKTIESLVAHDADDATLETCIDTSAAVVTVEKSEVWRSVQERIKDTVVQVFAHVAEVDMLQPFKAPSQYPVYGSAFFINDDGDLITNAHVINQAKAVWIQIPSLGKRIIDVAIVGISPERDLALLRVKPESLAIIKKELGRVPFLPLGDSDGVHRADEVLALGYPLGQQSLKSTSGVISGREHHYIQMSAAINPGSSGGPLLNMRGEVVGINSAGITEAQNVGYIIPINDLKIVLSQLYQVPLLRKPFLGVLFNNGTESMTEYLGNPQPGGCYVVEVIKGSPLYNAGVKRGDMIYEVNGNRIDLYGDMTVPWSEDKISLVDFVGRLATNQKVNLVCYRKGTRREVTVKFSESELPAVRKVYPGFEPIDYEIVGGMVIMQLTLNHVFLMGNNAPGLAKYLDSNRQADATLIVTHIFPNSQLYRSRALAVGSTIKEVNGKECGTLEELRAILRDSVGKPYLTFKGVDNIARTTDNIFVVLPWKKVLEEEITLARDYRYEPTPVVKELLAQTFKDKMPQPAAPLMLAGPDLSGVTA